MVPREIEDMAYANVFGGGGGGVGANKVYGEQCWTNHNVHISRNRKRKVQ